MSKKYFVLLLVLQVGLSYGQVTFNGTVFHSPNQKVWLTDFFGKKLDSAIISVDSQKFVLRSDVKKERLLLIKYEKIAPYNLKQFIVVPGENITFSFDVNNNDKYQWVEVLGSPYTRERLRLNRESAPLQLHIDNNFRKIDSVEQSDKKHACKQQRKFQAEIDRSQMEIDVKELRILDTTMSVQNSQLVFGLLCRSSLSNPKKRDSILAVLKNKFPDNQQVQAMQVYMVVNHESLPINSKIPDIVLYDLSGKKIDLHKIDQRYLLIHFWASWCKPCREETPELIRTFKAFNKRGFKVLLVSIDSDWQAWKTAINADGTSEFINVNDPLASKSKYLKNFKIIGIPENFLIDHSGTIVSEDFGANDLYKKMSSLIEEKE